jgi:hypothetical protein
VVEPVKTTNYHFPYKHIHDSKHRNTLVNPAGNSIEPVDYRKVAPIPEAEQEAVLVEVAEPEQQDMAAEPVELQYMPAMLLQQKAVTRNILLIVVF